MNLDAKNQHSIFHKAYRWEWKSMLLFELYSFYGRYFLKKYPKKTKENLLHLGCGMTYFEDWVNADFYYFTKLRFWKKQPKIEWMLDLRYPLSCENEYWEGVFSEHTIEHIDPLDAYNLFCELFRTMKKGTYIRLCVPGLDESLKAFQEPESEEGRWMRNDLGFTTKAEMIRHLTQSYRHLSCWDEGLMCALLSKAGFSNCKKVSFMVGNDTRLLKDSESRRLGSMYVEAFKPH